MSLGLDLRRANAFTTVSHIADVKCYQLEGQHTKTECCLPFCSCLNILQTIPDDRCLCKDCFFLFLSFIFFFTLLSPLIRGRVSVFYKCLFPCTVLVLFVCLFVPFQVISAALCAAHVSRKLQLAAQYKEYTMALLGAGSES